MLPKYPSVNLVTVAYGDDLSDKSYREAVGLLKSYPDLKVIVSPSSVGIVAAAQAVKDQGKIGKVYVTGLGLPSEMAGAIKSGASKASLSGTLLIWATPPHIWPTIWLKGQRVKPKPVWASWVKYSWMPTATARWPSRSFTMPATSINSQNLLTPFPTDSGRENWRIIMMASTPLLSLKGITKVFPVCMPLRTYSSISGPAK